MRTSRALLRRLGGGREPVTDGVLTVPGIDDEVVVRRDAFGIPHITAGGDADAGFGLGFCIGQDRTFQLEMLLRMVRGTAAELLGEAAVPVDRLSRRVGFAVGAGGAVEASDADTRAWLEAHVRGLNAGAEVGRDRPPHELSLLRGRRTRWTPADVVGVARLLGFLLPSNWDAELVRLKIALTDGADAVADLDVGYPRGGPVVDTATGATAEVDRLAEDLEAFADVARLGGGSNAWALAGSRTASGRPLLASDPHLAPTVPPHWYLAHLRTPGWSVGGAALVGVGAFLVGQNDHAAWGVTAGLVDNTDLVVERFDGDRVLVGDEWVPCERRTERIAVRGGDDVVEEVLVTPNGPVVSPALADAPVALSLRATWLEPRPLDVILLHRAMTFEELRGLAADWAGAPLNVLWAQASGGIGWQLVGRPPVRRSGSGTLPVPGWDPDAAWTGELLPFEEMPWTWDPGTGYLVSANNPPRGGDVSALGRDWLDAYRAARIEELVAARDDWDVTATQDVQLDVTSRLWCEIADVVLAAPVGDGAGRVAVELLRGWDGRVTGDSPAASVFELLTAGLYRRVVEARAPGSAEWALGAGLTALTPRNYFPKRRGTLVSRLLREQPGGWLEVPWDEVVAGTLAAAVEELRRRFGPDPDDWAWGRVRPLVLRHVLGSKPPLDRVFNLGPFPAGGDHDTPSQHGVAAADPTTPVPVHPSLRAVMDPGDPSASRFALPGGQSGNPASPHFVDQLGPYSGGRGVPIPWTAEEVAHATRRTLHLRPA